MILEGGYDLLNLSLPYFDFADPAPKPWVVIPTDKDLRCYGVIAVPRPDPASPIELQIDEILAALGSEYVKYFAIAEACAENRFEFDDGFQDGFEECELLADAATARGLDYFNHVYVGSESWIATEGMGTFKTYFGLERLPRAIVAHAPHPEDLRG